MKYEIPRPNLEEIQKVYKENPTPMWRMIYEVRKNWAATARRIAEEREDMTSLVTREKKKMTVLVGISTAISLVTAVTLHLVLRCKCYKQYLQLLLHHRQG